MAKGCDARFQKIVWRPFTSRVNLQVLFTMILTASLATVYGCGSSGSRSPSASPTPTPTSTPTPTPLSISGSVQGGAGGIAGAMVTLYAAGPANSCSGSSCYGAGAMALGTSSSDSSGDFNLEYTCPAGNEAVATYIVASGGNPGSGNNSAIGLMALAGPCNNLSRTTYVTVNGLTTVAAQWALTQFIDTTGTQLGTSSTNAAGFSKAINQSMNDLVTSVGTSASDSGVPASFLPTAADCEGGSPPINCDALERLNTLANIVASCINTAGPSSNQCAQLFCGATAGASWNGTNCSATPAISDTLAAVHAIVANPGSNVSTIFGVTPPTGLSLLAPALSAAPDNWELVLNFAPSGANLQYPGPLAMDNAGNLFTGNLATNTVSELTAASSYTVGLSFAPSDAALDNVQYLVIDISDDLFLTNSTSNSVSELTAASGYASGLNFTPSGAAMNLPDMMGLDTSGNLFVANLDTNSVSELTAISGYTSGLNFTPSAAYIDYPLSLALDASNNAFVVNYANPPFSVSELTAASGYATGLNFAPSSAAFDYPASLALDAAGDIFVANVIGNSVSELTAASSYATGLNFAPAGAAFDDPRWLVVDSSANVFVANLASNSVAELTGASNYATGYNFAPSGAPFDNINGLALDASGNVFLTNGLSNSVSEIIGLAAPVMTPPQQCLINGHNVCLP